MKKLLATAAFLVIGGIGLMSQTPPPQPDDPSSGGGTGPVGGGAPVGSGLIILLTLGAAYGGKKVYELKKDYNEKNNRISNMKQ